MSGRQRDRRLPARFIPQGRHWSTAPWFVLSSAIGGGCLVLLGFGLVTIS